MTMLHRLPTALATLTLTAALSLPSGALADPITYEVDKAHSNVTFKIRHLLTYTFGKFRDFEGTITVDPDKRDSVSISGTIDVASIDTNEADRDEHLRNEDFFDVPKHPKITFTAGELTDVNADRTSGKLQGTLTMKGVTRPIVLDVEWLGTATDPWGNKKAVFSGKTRLKRKDYGIEFNKVLDSGGLLIGEDVEIEINIEANEPKPEPKPES